jgi:Zn-finger protein
VETGSIQITPKKNDLFTTPSLKRFYNENEGASVVVRDRTTTGDVSDVGKSSNICALIESALLKEHFNVRDRAIFDRVMDKMGENIDYEKLSKTTGTDLIFEVISDGYVLYPVDSYYRTGSDSETQLYEEIIVTSYDKKGKPINTPSRSPVSYYFWGYYMEIKVIMLRENKVGGTYKYFYTPCSAEKGGCEITSFGPPLRCVDKDKNKYEKRKDGKDKDDDMNLKLSNFVSNIVIKEIKEDMGK